MRKAGLYFLVMVYLMAFARPFAPYLSYEVNKNLIASVFCVERDLMESDCKGSCYLNTQLSKKSDLDTPLSLPQILLAIAPHMSLDAEMEWTHQVQQDYLSFGLHMALVPQREGVFLPPRA